MQLIINDDFKKINRVRIRYVNGTCTVNWPVDTDLNLNDRKKKIHDSITRCFAHDPDFADPNVLLKSNVQVARLDTLEYCDLHWEAIDLSDDA